MSLEVVISNDISTDIVSVTSSIDFSDHWSKVAPERILLKADDVRTRGSFFRHLISNDAKPDILK